MKDINLKINDIAIEYFDGNSSKFAFEMGTSEANIRNYRVKTSPKVDFVVRLCEKLEINYEWLLNNKGVKFKKDSTIYKVDTSPKIVELYPVGDDNVILLDAKAAAYTFSNSYNEPIDLKNSETLRLPKLQHRKGKFFALEISGDSMHPNIVNGDYVICKQIPIPEFIGGHVYVLWHIEHGMVCKRIKWINQKKGILSLQSDNEHISDWDIHISEVTAMLEVECKLSFNLRNWNSDLRQDVNNLQEQMIDVNRKLDVLITK